jgi:hypothetical protein
MRLFEKLVSAASLSVILGGLGYAYGRESLSRTDLNPVFQEINREYFDGELSGVTVEWATLDRDSGQARKLGEREFVILVDRRENTSVADVRGTLEHEACHVFVDWKEPEEHGPIFQRCIARFFD